MTKHSQSDNTGLPEEVRAMTITITSVRNDYTAEATFEGRTYCFTDTRRYSDTERDVMDRLTRRTCGEVSMDAGWPGVCQDANGDFFFGVRDESGRVIRVPNETAKMMIATGSLRAAQPRAERLMKL